MTNNTTIATGSSSTELPEKSPERQHLAAFHCPSAGWRESRWWCMPPAPSSATSWPLRRCWLRCPSPSSWWAWRHASCPWVPLPNAMAGVPPSGGYRGRSAGGPAGDAGRCEGLVLAALVWRPSLVAATAGEMSFLHAVADGDAVGMRCRRHAGCGSGGRPNSGRGRCSRSVQSLFVKIYQVEG